MIEGYAHVQSHWLPTSGLVYICHKHSVDYTIRPVFFHVSLIIVISIIFDDMMTSFKVTNVFSWILVALTKLQRIQTYVFALRLRTTNGQLFIYKLSSIYLYLTMSLSGQTPYHHIDLIVIIPNGRHPKCNLQTVKAAIISDINLPIGKQNNIGAAFWFYGRNIRCGTNSSQW